MKQNLLITNGKIVKADRIIPNGEVYIEDGIIQYAGKQIEHHGIAGSDCIDAGGGYILPGLIDIHSDAIEKEIEPRPGTYFSPEIAFRELEKKLAGNGITTIYHSFSLFGAKGQTREDKNVESMIRTIVKGKESLALIRNKVHLRFEISNTAGVVPAKSLLEDGLVDLLSFMDHIPGQGQYPTVHDYMRYMQKNYDMESGEIEEILSKQSLGQLLSGECVDLLSKSAVAAGIPMASHDDDTPQKVRYYHKRGISIHEFPINLETAVVASELGNYISVGAPNILRGRSSGKGMRAVDAVKTCSANIICSDYYPPAMLHAVFKLADEVLPFYEAISMASSTPAQALGLNTGRLEEGRWGDVIIVRKDGDIPIVMNTVVAGSPVYGVNYRVPECIMPAKEEQSA
ncbi:MAG: alpha-D-ribose 1-methylphosphonate 5-triphosphate diphosphatase [Syntrophomonadaceae bacterium]|nr:alpha-D-ribose 1-methylphosphonate 5-triphosphate diphosphatase [Syntrophomonadaceae bacterium]